ncbi:hypothetical protein [Mycoplasma sp. 4423]
MIKSIYEELIELIDEEINKHPWKLTDKFASIRKIQIDQRGRVGEKFFTTIFKELNKEVIYQQDGFGDWDIVVDGVKIEIKTATLDVSKKFQHEGIKENKSWDVIAFLDIAPNDLYISFIHKDDFKFGLQKVKNDLVIKYGTVKINGKIQNIHFRGKEQTSKRATGSGYKVDFKLEDLKITRTLKDIKNIYEQAIKEKPH